VVVPEGVALDDELDEEDWLWSVEVVPVVVGVESAVLASADAPGGAVRSGTAAGTTSCAAWSLPQALRPRAATARRASTGVRI
jgi:hypothetical protein